MSSRTTFGRPRTFDEQAALTAAMEAFWEGGFNGTSYDDLEKVTKLRRQSLIYAFGDKQKMFQKALGLYAARRVEEIVAILDRDGSALGNVEAVFESWLGDVDHGRRNGCLLVNTAGELGRSNPEVAAAVTRATERLRGAFAKAFSRAQDVGEIGDSVDPFDLACLAVAAGDGALLHGRASGKSVEAVSAFRALLKLLR